MFFNHSWEVCVCLGEVLVHLRKILKQLLLEKFPLGFLEAVGFMAWLWGLLIP